ncbi:MAG: cellulase family glycosylhydrolase, partial [Clostridia bacterium]|nr:cellulase family glycosylhydrolase [Clostridia bacterium]
MERIFTKGTAFVDKEGRERIFNGVNLCDKGVPTNEDETDRKYTYEYDEKLFRTLAENGFNILRLGTTWEAIEPKPGEYNDEYIEALRKMLDTCEKYGIYVYLDMHQDLYSAHCYQWGDGAPEWACLMGGVKRKNIKLVWAEGYFWGKGVQTAYDNFWLNKQVNGKGLLDWYADMWKHVAEKLGDHPALFGFDMLNEPFMGKDGGRVFRTLIANLIKTTLTDKRIKKGKLIKDALKLDIPAILDQYNGGILRDVAASAEALVEKFDRERYTPFLNKTASAIRSATDNGIMFIDNCYYSNLSIPCKAGPITYGDKVEDQACFSPHGYDFMVDTPLYKHASSSRTDAIFGEHENTQKRLGVPVLVGEWGGYSEGNEWYPHVHHLLRFFDDRKWSNTYWCFHEGL